MIPHVTNSDENLDETDAKFQFTSLKIPWYEHILLNRPLKVVLAMIISAVAIPLLIYNFYFFTTFDMPPDAYSVGTCLIPRENRIPCGIGNVPQEECHSQCCYDLSSHYCFHRVPSRFSYISAQPWHEDVRIYPRVSTVPYNFQDSLPNIKLSIDERSDTHIVLHIYDPTKRSFTGNRLDQKEYVYEVSTPEMGIVVNSTRGTIFNMARGPLIASQNIWETSFILTNESMYGLGEIPLRVNVTKVLYNNDKGVAGVPLIFARVEGRYHGLLIESDDPTEISVHGENRIVVRSITNLGFTFHLFVGPKPRDVMQDVMKIIGGSNKLEYWMLGAHVCNELPEEDLTSFLAKAAAESLPYESICGHGPLVFDSNQCRDNITNTDFEDGANLVRRSNKRFIPHISPYIRYHGELQNSNETENTTETEMQQDIEEENNDVNSTTCGILPNFKNIILRDSETLDIYKGVVDNEEVIYPNYEDASHYFMEDLWPFEVTPDGIILENNWPYDESEKVLNETGLPYFSKDFQLAFNKTPQWNLVHSTSNKSYLFEHQNYGNNFVNVFRELFNESMIWSSSQRMQGQIGINRQKIDISWTNLRKELVEAALGGISGHWFWSTPVCGDTEAFDIETHASLCVKWYMAETYFPMIKIHSKSNPRHPLAFTGTHKALILKALNDRISFLPHFYTILQKGPLLRPMFYQFPESEILQDLSTQFSVGDDLLIVPNLEPSQSHVHVWMPPGTWYEFWSGMKLTAAEGEVVTLTTTESDFLTLIRGGSVVAIQQDTRDSVEQTRWLSSFSIIIALESFNETFGANGSLYITDNMTLNFQANSQNFTITATGDDFDPICDWFGGTWAYDIRKIRVYGLEDEFNNFDNHREITSFVDICLLETRDEIVVDLTAN
ncbi:maltase-glucoamylase, intestinal-like [Aricia agestis]|uniref:maltase-glucoamylase, intestinal-like n=1 Tax=Aricia agestis TaxID=91739 RepID=UPI001C2080E8|nr:maltase-glucoamylase, intestinal-like [Aricia agestis]XP_041980748.1 maltase-glucoamylase, intestinal-like [Aricia agestis]